MNRKLKALLIAQGIKQKDIALRAGVSRITVSCVLGGHAESRPIKQATADLLKISYNKLETLWERKAA
jgi:transcriptional regulator with XRE-family HTH domain